MYNIKTKKKIIRAAPDIDIGFDLPYKRQQVYQRVSEDILEVVEADHQPCQEP